MTHEVSTRVTYVTPPNACAEQDPTILFKSGTIQDNRLYICTQTEVLLYTLPDFTQVGYLSLPCFNDVHHVRPTPTNNLLIANSGLDMVLEVTLDGTIVKEWNVLGKEPWARFSRTVDYRKGISTKPHASHPNHVFYLGDEPWATRFEQHDAISLTDPQRRIALGTQRVHDGVLHEGMLYFTSVNGNVIVVNSTTLDVETIIDLNEMHDEQIQLGWCRGVMPHEKLMWVGFSRLRPTKWRENVSWVLNRFNRASPTHIACYDLAKGQCTVEIDLEAHGLNAIFGVFPAVTLPDR